MPVFDLKNATIRFKDGYSDDTGKVDNALGYAAAATTMAVDGFTVIPPVGATFNMFGETARYLITASTLTSITFTPGLLDAVSDNDVIEVGPRQADVKMGDGTLTASETKNREYIKDRGRIDEIRNGDEEPVDVSIDAQLQFVTGHSSDPGGGQPTIGDILNNVGLASSWISSETDDPCRPYAVDIEIYYEPPCDSIYGEVATLRFFRHEKLDYDFKAGTIKCSGKCNVPYIEAVRFDQSP